MAWTLMGCADDGDVHLLGDQVDLSVVPTASPATSMESPAQPTAQRSEFGAEAHVRYALDVIDYAATTGDTEELLALSRAGCIPCADAGVLIDAGKTDTIPQESLVRGSTSIEGDAARTMTRVDEGSEAWEREWRLGWTDNAWQFAPFVG